MVAHSHGKGIKVKIDMKITRKQLIAWITAKTPIRYHGEIYHAHFNGHRYFLFPLMGGECLEDGKVVDGELHACRFWVTVQGKHPQSGEVVNTADCAFCWTPVLLIENSKVNRETGAAVESFRNEMVSSNELVVATALLLNNQKQKLLEG